MINGEPAASVAVARDPGDLRYDESAECRDARKHPPRRRSVIYLSRSRSATRTTFSYDRRVHGDERLRRASRCRGGRDLRLVASGDIQASAVPVWRDAFLYIGDHERVQLTRKRHLSEGRSVYVRGVRGVERETPAGVWREGDKSDAVSTELLGGRALHDAVGNLWAVGGIPLCTRGAGRRSLLSSARRQYADRPGLTGSPSTKSMSRKGVGTQNGTQRFGPRARGRKHGRASIRRSSTAVHVHARRWDARVVRPAGVAPGRQDAGHLLALRIAERPGR